MLLLLHNINLQYEILHFPTSPVPSLVQNDINSTNGWTITFEIW